MEKIFRLRPFIIAAIALLLAISSSSCVMLNTVYYGIDNHDGRGNPSTSEQIKVEYNEFTLIYYIQGSMSIENLTNDTMFIDMTRCQYVDADGITFPLYTPKERDKNEYQLLGGNGFGFLEDYKLGPHVAIAPKSFVYLPYPSMPMPPLTTLRQEEGPYNVGLTCNTHTLCYTFSSKDKCSFGNPGKWMLAVNEIKMTNGEAHINRYHTPFREEIIPKWNGETLNNKVEFENITKGGLHARRASVLTAVALLITLGLVVGVKFFE